MNRRCRKVVVAFLCVILAAPLFWFLMPRTIGDGYFSLTVTLKSADPVKAVSYALFEDEETGRQVADGRVESEYRPARRVGERDFEVRVYFSDVVDVLGFQRSYFHPGFVVLLVEFENGDKMRRLLSIPAGHGPHAAELEFR